MSVQNITLYLHIGTAKTGTSSIQNFLAGNNKILWNSCACLYPNVKENQILKGNFINHMYLFNSCDKKVILSKIRRAIAFCKKNAKERVVFSAESLFESPDGPALAKEISEIPGVDLRVIVYLRRQDSWLESAWKQWGYKTPDNRDIADYIQKRDCNWYKRLQKWEGSVGKERLIVRCYEKEQLPRGLIPDFLSLIGIDYPAHTWIDREDIFKGFQRDVMEIMFLNKDFCTGDTDNRLQSFFERNLDKSFQKESFKSYSFLSPAERISILKKYEDSNRDIARQYLNRDDGVLFKEPPPSENDAWEPYNGLTFEKIVPIFVFILYNMHENFNKKVRAFQKKTSWQQKIRNRLQGLMKTGTSKR